MYEVWLERATERDLKRLPTKYFKLIIKRIKKIAYEPRPSGCRKIVGSKNDFRIRIGDYRIIYEIDDKKKMVRIMRVVHRKSAYR